MVAVVEGTSAGSTVGAAVVGVVEVVEASTVGGIGGPARLVPGLPVVPVGLLSPSQSLEPVIHTHVMIVRHAVKCLLEILAKNGDSRVSRAHLVGCCLCQLYLCEPPSSSSLLSQ